MKKPKKFTREFDLSEFGEGNFILRITESRAEVETKVKNWKVMFGASSYEYGMMSYCASKNDLKPIYTAVLAIFYSRLSFQSVIMASGIFKLVEEYAAQKATAQEVSEREDAEILAEEKVLTEQTQEAIEELEEIRRENNNEK